jgi:hypothetical protein
VIATEVVRSGATYRLARVGIGNAIPLHGREVIVSDDGPPQALATLSTVEHLVLRAAEAKLSEGQLIFRTPTFALLRAPTTMVIAGRHRSVNLHYAFLVDPGSGQQTTLLWKVPAGMQEAPDKMIELPPDAIFDAALDVMVERRVGPIPITWSFALVSLPNGRPITVPERVGKFLQGGAGPEVLERALRSLAGRSVTP